MPYIYPSSAGADRGAQLLEFNPCHEPAGSSKGGQFAPKGQGNCAGEGSIGQLDSREAVRFTEALARGTRDVRKGLATVHELAGFSHVARGEVKYQIALKLAEALDGHPELDEFAAARRDALDRHYRYTRTREEHDALYRAYVEKKVHEQVQVQDFWRQRDDYYSRLRQAQREGYKAVDAFLQQHGSAEQWLAATYPEYKTAVEAEVQKWLTDPDKRSAHTRAQQSLDYESLQSASTSPAARAVASFLVQQWAETSADSNPLSLALQVRANAVFNLSNAYSRLAEHTEGMRRHVEQTLEGSVGLFDTFLRAQYDQTQAWLKANNIQHVTLYRGMSVSSEVARQFGRGGAGDVALQPVSSFSSQWVVARDFATELSGSTRAQGAVVMAIRVPASKVFSTSRTGIGCLNEGEATLLGGVYRAWIADARIVEDEAGFFGAWARSQLQAQGTVRLQDEGR